MPKHFLTVQLALVLLFKGAMLLPAQDTNASAAEAAYTQTLEKRVADILDVLKLTEPPQHKNVHDLLIAQYRTLNGWHNANDTKRKAAKGEEAETFKNSLKAIHDKFIAALAVELTPAQVEQVKDKMTYGKVQFTFTGYLNEYPDLSDPHKQRVLELLKEAREEAMDGGSSDEKSAIFNRYKGKINNYLSAQGVVSARKKKAATTTTNSPVVH